MAELLAAHIDEYVAETSLLAEHVLHPLKQMLKGRTRPALASRAADASVPRTPPPPVAREREKPQ